MGFIVPDSENPERPQGDMFQVAIIRPGTFGSTPHAWPLGYLLTHTLCLSNSDALCSDLGFPGVHRVCIF